MNGTMKIKNGVETLPLVKCRAFIGVNDADPCSCFLYISSGFGGLEVACWPLVPKFAGSNPAEAVGFLRVNKKHVGGHRCLSVVIVVCCQVESLRQTDHSSRGVLPTVVRRCVWSTNLMYEATSITQLWLNCPWRSITGWNSSMPLILTVKQDCWMSSDRLQQIGR